MSEPRLEGRDLFARITRSAVALVLVLGGAAIAHGSSYKDAGHATLLAPGTCVTLVGDTTLANPTGAEQPAATYRSRQIAVPGTTAFLKPEISFEVTFAGNPGAFQYEVQDADTDTSATYVPTISGVKTTCPISDGGTYVCNWKFSPWRGNFASIYVRTAAAAVNVTLKACR